MWHIPCTAPAIYCECGSAAAFSKECAELFCLEQVRKAQDYLDGWPAEPDSPMRYQHDIDISAGYMHSGWVKLKK